MIDPILLSFGNFEIRWYGVFMALAIVSTYYFFKWSALKFGFDQKFILTYFFVAVIGLLVGGRIFYVLRNFNDYLLDPFSSLIIWGGGISFYGSFVGSFIVAYLYCKNEGVDFLKTADAAILPLLSAMIVGRFANFFNSEFVGKVTSSIFGVTFDGVPGMRHPTQLYQATFNFLIIGFLIYVFRRNFFIKKNGDFFFLGVFLFSLGRFIVEFFRDFVISHYGLTLDQWLSVILCAFSLYFILYGKAKSLKTPSPLQN